MKWYVVNVQNLCIDSEWPEFDEANARAATLVHDGLSPGAVKVMTKPRVGGLVLDPKDAACWSPRRNNPRGGERSEIPVVGETIRVTAWGNTHQGVVTFADEGVIHIEDLKGDEHQFSNDRNMRWERVAVERANPAGMVKTPRDERLWKMAKKSAAEQGRKGDWAYVVGIFKRMQSRSGGAGVGALRENGRLHPKTPSAAEFSTQRQSLKVEHHDGTTHTFSSVEDLNEANKTLNRLCKELEGVGCLLSWRGVLGTAGDALRTNVFLDRGPPRENHGERRRNPEPDSAQAEAVYEMWHKKEPHQVFVLDTGCDINDAMVCVGKAHNIVYRSGKWESGRKTNDYVHHFDSKPSVYMLVGCLGDVVGVGGVRENPERTVDSLLKRAKNADGQFAVAELATPLSFGLDDGNDGTDIDISSGARVYGAIDQKTVIIVDPGWGLVVIKGGKMFFDERGIVN
jgi:hypothetical protein